jgi:hypothetical protein
MIRLAASTSLSRAQIVAYELSSLEQSRLLDDVAHLVWDAWGEHGLAGRLAEEARWAAFVLHDRIAVHAVRDAGVSKHRLAVGAISVEEVAFHRPNQLRDGAPARDERARAIVTSALRTARAAFSGMSAGYGAVYAPHHPVVTALRDADAATAALQREIAAVRLRDEEAHEAIRPRVVRASGEALLRLWSY